MVLLDVDDDFFLFDRRIFSHWNERSNFSNGQTEIGDATGQIFFDENIFRFQISMGNGRFPIGRLDRRVKVTEATGDAEHHLDENRPRDRFLPEIIAERTERMIFRDQPEFSVQRSVLNEKFSKENQLDVRTRISEVM